ncbi:MAG: diguanylate cyclase precursor [Herbinix sp.]|nr:diguanylate cyclase precursor [Herbinix sp.]
MNRIKLDKKSIVYRVTSLVIILIVAQAVFLSIFLILGGVLSQARKNAYSNFSDKVINRKEYLQREMSTRWTNLDPYLNQIAELLPEDPNTDQFFADISEDLISIMRSTQATGAFVILEPDTDQEYPVLYLRDYDPVLNDYGNKDLYMLFGPSEIANNMQIPLDQMWRHKMDFQNMEHSFYEEAYLCGDLTDHSNPLGCWSLPFRLFPEDIPILTYTLPLMTKNNKVIGVIGVEISTQYFRQFLPSTDLQNRDSLGYVIGYKEAGTQDIVPVLYTRSIQNQILIPGNKISYSRIDEDENIYLLEDPNVNSDIYFCMEEMDLYSDNTPFEDEQWYLIGLMGSNFLLSFVYKLRSIIFVSLITSVLLGIVGGYLVSYRFTKPIILLAQKVKNSDPNVKMVLEETGLAEVDELSHAIQTANDSLLESTIKMSRIIDLAGLPIGAFEYRADNNYVFVTEQLMTILCISSEEAATLKGNKKLFQDKIKELRNYQDPEEENVYTLPTNPNKWIKLKEVIDEKLTIGIITDVTDEIIEKKNIIQERDYDYLTQIYNRNALHRVGEAILAGRDHGLEAAVMMFDLDNLKDINDTYGHEWGDKYIKFAVLHLQGFNNDRMMLGRRSGDEFVIFLHNFTSRDEIRTCVNNFYLGINVEPIRFPDGSEKPVQISSGLVWVKDYDVTFDQYLEYADAALYQAKKWEKGTCSEYNSSIQSEDSMG